jgi:hypothetical protein
MFDTPPASAITATDSVTVIDPGAVVNHILDINQDFTVQVSFQLDGANVQFLGGEWTVSVYASGLTLLFSAKIAEGKTDVVPTDGHPYQLDLKVTPLGLLPEGVYQLTIVITNQNPKGGPDTEMAGFNQGSVIDIREP